MPYQATVLRVLVASPGDVAAEREVVREVIHEWNAVHSEHTGIVLLPALWETHASPLLGERAQAVINRQFADECDLLIGMFWARLGTPTGEAESGTVEEVRRHVAAGRPAMLYFSNAPVRLDSVDEEQYRRLREFRKEMMASGLVAMYESVADFREQLVRQLAIAVHEHFGAAVAAPAGSAEPRSAALSEEARRLLQEAVRDPQGHILQLHVMGGVEIQTNESLLVSPGDARAAARWKAALRELCDAGLVDAPGEGGEVFTVTHRGYEAADRLAPGIDA